MKFDVLIVGAGGAGLYSALEAAKNAKDLKKHIEKNSEK